MAITRTIGKNTLGDNNKMHVRLREYDMSSQNLNYGNYKNYRKKHLR
nr:MAG TPA_asm: hypothetical protein [Microviridae sp.]